VLLFFVPAGERGCQRQQNSGLKLQQAASASALYTTSSCPPATSKKHKNEKISPEKVFLQKASVVR
jgi:hypothetical protein